MGGGISVTGGLVAGGLVAGEIVEDGQRGSSSLRFCERVATMKGNSSHSTNGIPIRPTPEALQTLLLTGYWKDEEPVSPLTPREYSLLVETLREREISLAELSLPDVFARYEANPLSDLPPIRLTALLAREEAVEAMLKRWAEAGISLVCREDGTYPAKLKSKLEHSAPPLLYVAGDLAMLNEPVLAMVGSRNADREALEFTVALGASCARAGITVVSGGARGVDSAAMKGALEEGGCVAGVLAGDLMRSVALPENESLISSGRLTLIGMRAPESPFTVPAAMERNKAIYALADAAVIVCADEGKGGTWAGAEENGRRRWTVAFARLDTFAGGSAKLISRGWAMELPANVIDDPMRLLSAQVPDTKGGETLGLGF